MKARLPWWNRMHGTREMGSCLQVTRALQRYLDGELDDVAVRRIARHLEVCRRCGLEATTYTEIKRAVARRGGAPPAGAIRRLERFGERLATGESPPDGQR